MSTEADSAKRTKTVSGKERVRRWGVLCLGLFIAAFGIGLVTDSNLGTAPISSLPYVLSLIGGLSFGGYTFLINLLFFAAQRLILGGEFRAAHWLQLPVILVFSAFIDLARLVTVHIAPESYPLHVLMCVAGSMLIGLGVSIEVVCRLTVVPGEGLVMAIAYRSKRILGNVKILFDVSLVLMALVLAFFWFGDIAGIRERARSFPPCSWDHSSNSFRAGLEGWTPFSRHDSVRGSDPLRRELRKARRSWCPQTAQT